MGYNTQELHRRAQWKEQSYIMYASFNMNCKERLSPSDQLLGDRGERHDC